MHSPDPQVAEPVNFRGEVWMNRDGRPVFLDHSRAADHITGCEPGPGVYIGSREIEAAAKAHRAAAGPGPVRVTVSRLKLRQPGTANRAYPGDPQVDPLHMLAGIITEVVAVEGPVRVVKCAGDRVGDCRVERRTAAVRD